tara:strand:+ start:22438 stop:23682 length:1245 start_codon:yes stop_codon:yes gene_type:complete
MAIFKPFKAFRPRDSLAQAVASKPYDVLNSAEAKKEAKDNAHSFLRVIKPEIELPENTDPYCEEVYEKGRENFLNLCRDGVLSQDPIPSYYLYRLTMNGRSQTGLVGCCEYQEYYEGRIKKHELTRTVKENDRVRHVECLNANAEPVFFSYRGVASINEFVEHTLTGVPLYDFVAEDGVRHELWAISESGDITLLEQAFLSVPDLYVADGHHRTAAAARVGQKRKDSNPEHRGDEEYNFFMAVLFPDDQLEIFDYNRVVKDLNGLSPDDFVAALSDDFDIQPAGKTCPRPAALREFSLYLDGSWYELRAKTSPKSSGSPIGDLDVTVLSEKVLGPLLAITDLRNDNRIDFVGGIRGLEELERLVDSGEMAAAFALYPVSMEQLLNIADAGEIMPPKTTWFEPKLRSGLFVHGLE